MRAFSRKDGAGVHLLKAFGIHQVPDYDPFLMLDHFGGDDPSLYRASFPWQPLPCDQWGDECIVNQLP